MTETAYSHLDAAVKPVADWDAGARIRFIGRDRFIKYPQVNELLEDFELLLNSEDSIRPQGRLLVGDSLSGKTSVLNEFMRRHPASDHPDGRAVSIPVLYIQYPDTASEGVFGEILNKLNINLSGRVRPPEIRSTAVNSLKASGVRVLIIDEFHNLLEGSANAQRKGLNSVKFLINDLGRPVIAAGTRSASTAIATDEQFRSRLRPKELARLRDDETFQGLLCSFEAKLPLRLPSNLFNEGPRGAIYRYSQGVMGYVSDILNSAAILAIKSGEEKISLELIEKAAKGGSLSAR